MDRCYENFDLKSGTIGIKVSILHSDVVLPDKMRLKTKEQDGVKVEQVAKTKSETKKEEKEVSGENKEKKKNKEKKSRKPRAKKIRREN